MDSVTIFLCKEALFYNNINFLTGEKMTNIRDNIWKIYFYKFR